MLCAYTKCVGCLEYKGQFKILKSTSTEADAHFLSEEEFAMSHS